MAAAAAATCDSCPVDESFGCNGKDSPVVTMMNKRLRALKKKYNRIVQIEESRDQGKPINKEQEEVLKSKVQVSALIEEYERLRQPLVASLKEEILLKQKEWLQQHHQQQQQQEEEEEEGTKDEETVVFNGGSEGTQETDRLPNGHHEDVQKQEQEEQGPQQQQEKLDDQQLADLIQMLYFALLFDIKTQADLQHLMWTRYHERSSCISYDYVTDDPTAPLVDADLSLLAKFGSLVVSRPPNATISHKKALEVCVAHARRWLSNSEEMIDDELNTSYAYVRERLNRITSSDYLTMTPELKTVTPELQTVTQHLNKTTEPAAVPQPESQENQEVPADPSTQPAPPAKAEASQKEANNQVVSNPTSPSDNSSEQVPHENGGTEQSETPQAAAGGEQQQQQQRRGGRSYQGPRVGGRGGYGGRGGNRGGYQGGPSRGGRGSRGGYQNGRGGGYANGRGGIGQYYEQHGGGGYYQQRPYYGGGRRGGATAHANGPPASTAAAAQS